MRSAAALAVALAALAALACNGDSGARAPAAPAPASGTAALPADRQCLPGNICDRWAGCALVERGPQWWTVVAADEVPAGEPVEVKDLCPQDTCVAARGIPKGAPCPPMTTPILVKPPDYTCVWDGSRCRKG